MKRKGFTLVEVLVVSVVLLILLNIGYDFLINNTRILNEEKQKAYIESQVKSVLDYITSSMQTAYQEKIELIEDIVNEDGVDKTINKLKIIVPEGNNNLNFEGNGTVIVIYYNDKEKSITLVKNGTSKSLLKGYISNFKLEVDDKFVSLEFDVDYKIRNLIKTYTINYKIRK